MFRSRVGVAGYFCLVLGCGSGADDPGAHVGAGGAGASGAGGSEANAGASGAPTPGTGGSGMFPIGDGGTGGTGEQNAVEQNLVSFRIEPENAVLSVALGQSQALEYHAFGAYASDPSTELDLTERTVFYVP